MISSKRLLRRALSLPLAIIFVLALVQIPVLAQMDSGRIVGVVTDSNGAIVPGASVAAKSEKTGEERAVTTNDSGAYIISGLRPASYTVTANGQNLTVRASNVQVLAGQELNLGL